MQCISYIFIHPKTHSTVHKFKEKIPPFHCHQPELSKKKYDNHILSPFYDPHSVFYLLQRFVCLQCILMYI